MIKGFLLVLSACAMWGLNFIVPALMPGYSPLEITLGGFFFLGIVSCFLIFHKWQSIPKKLWIQAIFFGLIGNMAYAFFLVTGLVYSNGSVIALIIGLSPITISFYGNWRHKECRNRLLIIPSILIASGLICVNWEAFISTSSHSGWEYAFGLICGLFALIAWNWYVVSNAYFLKENPTFCLKDWSSMIGVGTFVWVLMIAPLYLAFMPSEELQKYTQLEPSFIIFLIGSFVIGIFCYSLGFYLWNKGSHALPVPLAGQLTIFETIFGILFYYMLNFTLPTSLQFTGMIITLIGVFLCMHIFSKSQETTSQIVHSQT